MIMQLSDAPAVAYNRERLTRPLRMRQRGIAVLLIVCLLRALMPVDDLVASTGRAPAVAIGAQDYPCAGHACACGDREHCLAACCCFPREHGREASSIARFDARRVTELAPSTASSRRTAPMSLVRAPKCDGGAPRPAASAPTILSLEPTRVEWPAIVGDAPLVAFWRDGTLEHIRPDPPTPPPRAIVSAV
jgi:hypothetical protein